MEIGLALANANTNDPRVCLRYFHKLTSTHAIWKQRLGWTKLAHFLRWYKKTLIRCPLKSWHHFSGSNLREVPHYRAIADEALECESRTNDIRKRTNRIIKNLLTSVMNLVDRFDPREKKNYFCANSPSHFENASLWSQNEEYVGTESLIFWYHRWTMTENTYAANSAREIDARSACIFL